MRHALAVLVCCAASAFAQTKDAEAPQPVRSERPALNLKLDNPASFANVLPEPKAESAQPLPTLGGDARTVPVEKPMRTQTPASPYPPDTNEGR